MYIATREDLELTLIRKIGQMNDDELINAYQFIFDLPLVMINDEEYFVYGGEEYLRIDEQVEEGVLCMYLKQNPNDDLDVNEVFIGGKVSEWKGRPTIECGNNTFYFVDECIVVEKI